MSRDCRAWREILLAAKVHNGLWWLRIRGGGGGEGEGGEGGG